MGHVLQVKITGDSQKIPPSFSIIAEAIFPDMPKETEAEIFADCFAMAVMYNSQFSVYDPFDTIAPKHKALFQIYMRELTNNHQNL